MTVRNLNGVSTARVIAAVAAAGALGAALVGCTPDEPISHAPYTTPAVVTGNQAIPGDLVNADNIPSTGGEAGAVILSDKNGNKVGVASFTPADHSLKISVRVSDLKPGKHAVVVHTNGKCDRGSNFSGLGAPVANGTLVGVQVGEDGTGSTTVTVESLATSDVNGKALVVRDIGGDDAAPVACGVIAAR